MVWNRTVSPQFSWPITIEIPSSDPEKNEEFTFVGVFKRLRKTELVELQLQAKQSVNKDPAKFLCSFMVDWQGVVYPETNEPIPFSEQELAEACELLPCFVVQITQQYLHAVVYADRVK